MSLTSGNNLPTARYANLVTTETASDVLVYDTERNELHTLNSVAAAVWHSADGQRTAIELAQILNLEPELVEDALQRLEYVNLMETQVVAKPTKTVASRRKMLRNAAVGAVIISVTAPMAAAAISCPAGVTPITVDMCVEDGTICFTGVPGTGNACGCCKQAGSSGNWVCSSDCD